MLWRHFAGLSGVDLGRLGVEVFFVLSGWLMAEMLFIERKRLPQFFLRRFA